MKNIKAFISLTLAIFVTFWGSTQVASQSVVPKPEVVLMSEVNWSPLNPVRGDQSPQAGNLWGDRTTSGALGFLVKFADGFSSPPHIHNDDPDAKKMWIDGFFLDAACWRRTHYCC